MDHGYFEDRISAYRDKGLPADEYELIRQHLAECESCRKLNDRLERFDRLVRDNAELGDDLYWEQAAQKIEQRLGIAETVVTPVAKKGAWSGLGWKVTAAAASLVLIAIIAINKDKIFDEDEIMAPSPAPAMIVDTADSIEPDSASLSLSGRVPQATQQAEPESALDADTDESADDTPQAESSRMKRIPQATGGASMSSQAQEQANTNEARREVEPTVASQQPEEVQSSPAATSGARRGTPEAASSDEVREDVRSGISVDAQVESISKSLPAAPSPSMSIRGGRANESAAILDSVPVVDTIDRVRLAELESWRAVRDSLESFLSGTSAKKGGNMYEMMKPNSLQTDRRARTTQAAADPTVGLERQYLEACYQIARLAIDPLEAQSAQDKLRRVAGNPESPNREAARTLLDRLAAGK